MDGRPADIAGSLEGAVGDDLDGRLRALAAPPGRRRADAAAAREDAGDILAERRFNRTRVEGPFRGLLRRIGRLADPIRDLLSGADGTIPGPRWVVWAHRDRDRRRVDVADRRPHRPPPRGARARHLAALGPPHGLAGRARARRDRGRAPRRARAARCGCASAPACCASTSAARSSCAPRCRPARSSRRLHSDDFDRLAADFDSVVYGGRPAEAEDVEAARRGWDSVLR